jgi:hypothetical protein
VGRFDSCLFKEYISYCLILEARVGCGPSVCGQPDSSLKFNRCLTEICKMSDVLFLQRTRKDGIVSDFLVGTACNGSSRNGDMLTSIIPFYVS